MRGWNGGSGRGGGRWRTIGEGVDDLDVKSQHEWHFIVVAALLHGLKPFDAEVHR